MLPDAPARTSRLRLPDAPPGAFVQGVAVWEEALEIDTYLPEEPSDYPAFLDRRVYQGSSGRVYPLPFHERISSTKAPHRWRAVHIENEWIRLVILPELGGRVHVAYDKVAGYDLFYRNNVIKPALVGLTGPWVSGGIEFNWPQHHRPATFLPTDVSIERHEDGAVTVWCSDHDPFARMKGMHGIRLTPDSSRIEVHVRLYNRSELPQTFLWWANVAAAVGDDYQSFFPSDVRWVADHAKRAVVTFPEPDAPYYGIDYASRSTPESPDAGRLDWYRNIPVPTSYMALGSSQEFFGGYDHRLGSGFVHVAPREVSPGKKQWTWGNAPFGWAWDRNLTDDDGPYVELMAGVYTDNQPDFAFLAAGETKTFHQAWYPLRGIGPVVFADERLAVSLARRGGETQVGLCAAERLADVEVALEQEDGTTAVQRVLDLDPASTVEVPLDRAIGAVAVVLRAGGDLLGRIPLREEPAADPAERPAAAVAPPSPEAVPTVDELVHIAVYLDQYRHATRSSVPYYEEALRRDPEESRALLALGAKAYERAEYEEAVRMLSASARRATRWTSTPASGEAHYRLGLALARVGRFEGAADALALSFRDVRFAVSGRFALARLHSRTGDRRRAERLLDEALAVDPRHNQSVDLLATLLEERGDVDRAGRLAAGVLAEDPLDAWARSLLGLDPSDDATVVLDVALEYAAAGSTDRALALLDDAERRAAALPLGQVNVGPLIAFHRAALLAGQGNEAAAISAARAADRFGFVSAHPSRLDDVDALRAVTAFAVVVPAASALLGHWYYDRGLHDAAAAAWSAALGGAGPELAVVLHRNLGLCAFNAAHDQELATAHYRAAVAAAPEDAQLLYELDQLEERIGIAPADRLRRLEARRDVVDRRDDLTIAFTNLLMDRGRAAEAEQVLAARRFQPWEGGEGQVLAAWDRVCLLLAREDLASGRATSAAARVGMALNPPEDLGEGRHPLANVAELHLVLGDALAATGDRAAAAAQWERAAASTGDFLDMAATPFSRNTIHAAVALERLQRVAEAETLVTAVREWLSAWAVAEVEIDFFATSLPSMLLFAQTPAEMRDREVQVIGRQLDGWSGRRQQSR